MGSMLTKYLFGKPTRLWDLFLDQALFACRVRTQATTKTSPYYLVYGQQPRLVGDDTHALDESAPIEDYTSRLEQVRSARQEAAELTYERAVQAKEARDETVRPHDIEAGEWVLVRHENPQKFESKWFGPYQVVERMLLGTYRLQDPNGRELASLVHGNRLVKARVSSAEELQRLWAAPATKDQLRRRNLNPEWMTSDDERNTDLLERYLIETDELLSEFTSNDDKTQEVQDNTPPNEPRTRPQKRSRKRHLKQTNELDSTRKVQVTSSKKGSELRDIIVVRSRRAGLRQNPQKSTRLTDQGMFSEVD
jgi:hypothetical protein